MKPKIRCIEPRTFNNIEKILDDQGRWIGVSIRQEMTREELEKIYGPVEKLDISTAF